MPWKALGRGYNAILAQHYPAYRIHYLQRTGKLFPLKGRNFRPVFGKTFPKGWGKVGARVEARRG